MQLRANDPQTHAQGVRAQLLGAVRQFVESIKGSPGVIRIALIGSLTTDKRDPKDADVLVTIVDDLELASLRGRETPHDLEHTTVVDVASGHRLPG